MKQQKVSVSLFIVVLLLSSPAYASDILRTKPVSPGCHLGKDGREICPEPWDAYDYYPVSFCQVNKDGRTLTCPIARIFPRRPNKLHSVVVDFDSLPHETKRGIEVGLCVRSGTGGSDCPPAGITYPTGKEVVIEGKKAKSIIRGKDWADYMYLEVRNRKSNGLDLQRAVVGYRVTWLLKPKKK